MLNIFEYLHIFSKEKKLPYNGRGVFSAISATSWCLYVIAVILIISSLSYLYFERKRRNTNQLRLRGIRQLIEKPPQKRRPGAVAREREVFRNVLKTAHTYIYPNNEETKKCVVRQTRSGTIYGKFLDTKFKKAENKSE
ncbi:uncharacterized protein LOC129948077 isoform X2 [Eupeodes corollae]|uniref:uncharacterized protein LOC129948077 isoform X2 n=1 Tax=Eupeodes corollae TaxID=290404 RepID=UPI00248F9187|nr:uncharacterized protein LOC129948077 isoform X2 [Eupeodes corollae]